MTKKVLLVLILCFACFVMNACGKRGRIEVPKTTRSRQYPALTNPILPEKSVTVTEEPLVNTENFEIIELPLPQVNSTEKLENK